MSVWIKICGNTSLEDARLAVEAGADAVGFVFAPSPRRVTADQAARIAPHLPDTVEKIGVFVNAALDEIATTVEHCGLSGVQLHSECDAGLAASLRARLGPRLRMVRVVPFGAEASSHAAAIDSDPHVDAVMIDSRTATAAGGTGIAFDWTAARGPLFESREGRKQRIVAGGLNPANVAEAIATLRPWGVDVVSGVESTPGRKNLARVREFIANARAAAD
jgi:phosphoribosylanthranilate isomerase